MIRKWKETRNIPYGSSFSLKEIKEVHDFGRMKGVNQSRPGRNVENVTIEEESDSMDSSA